MWNNIIELSVTTNNGFIKLGRNDQIKKHYSVTLCVLDYFLV